MKPDGKWVLTSPNSLEIKKLNFYELPIESSIESVSFDPYDPLESLVEQ